MSPATTPGGSLIRGVAATEPVSASWSTVLATFAPTDAKVKVLGVTAATTYEPAGKLASPGVSVKVSPAISRTLNSAPGTGVTVTSAPPVRTIVPATMKMRFVMTAWLLGGPSRSEPVDVGRRTTEA